MTRAAIRPGGAAPTLPEALRIVELRTKIVSLSSFAIGTAWAAATGPAFSWPLCWLMLAATLAVDLGTAGFNSFYDYRDGVDTPETDVDGYKVLVHREIDPRAALWLGGAMFGAAAALGLVIAARTGWEIVAIGAACMTIAFFYSGGPWPLSRTPAGEIFAGGALGLVLIALSAYVQTRTVTAEVLLLGLPSTMLIAAILAANNACDVVGDAAAGRRTLAIVLGKDRAGLPVYALCGAALVLAVALVALRMLPPATLALLAVAGAFGTRELLRMRQRGFAHATKGPTMAGISAIFALYSLAILGGIGARALGH